MFSSISPSPNTGPRRTAMLCSAGAHVAAIAALWAFGQAITPPPVPPYEAREALTVISPPPRLFRPRPRPVSPMQRFEVEPAAATRMPEAVRETPQAPKIAVRPEATPILPQQPTLVAPSPVVKPAGFAEVARATAPKLEVESRSAAFGAALGRPEAARPLAPGGATGFGAVGLAKAQSTTAVAGDDGFGGVEIGRAARQTGTGGEAGFGAAERGLASVTASEPTAARSKNRPVKVLWKPVPQYSEEGLRRRIEGEVVLLVRFLARGTVETLKVVSGLGYGLDEYALEAAQSIRFEPATDGDRPIDYTAQVRIRFELAY